MEIQKMKLTPLQFFAFRNDWKHRIKTLICNQIAMIPYREQRKECVMDDDVADVFLSALQEKYDTSDYNDEELIEWIRDIQNDICDSLPFPAISLKKYIEDIFLNSQTEFARAQGVAKQQVSKWIKDDFIVIDHQLYSKRRDLFSNWL